MKGPLQDVPPGTNAVAEAYGWHTERRLDPVRAAALHEAVTLASGIVQNDRDHFGMLAAMQPLDFIEYAAERFETYLTGTDKAAT